MLTKDFHNILKKCRQERGLSQTDLANTTGIRPSTISNFEANIRKPSFSSLRRLADALSVTTDYLLGRDIAQGQTDAIYRHSQNLSPADKEFAKTIIQMLANKENQSNRKELMISDSRKLKIREQVNEILEKYKINELPVDPTKIAQKEDIDILPKHSVGVSGMLIKQDEKFFIFYSTHIDSRGYQNFSIAHELGHYFLDGHIDAILSNGKHSSQVDLIDSHNKYEWEANFFASELLMPKEFIKKDIERNDLSWDLVYNIATKCHTSLEATARRIIHLSEDICTLLIQHDNEIWTPIRSSSWTGFIGMPAFPEGILECEEDNFPSEMEKCEFDDWGMEDISEYDCYYSSIRHNLGRKKRIMTLLRLEEKSE